MSDAEIDRLYRALTSLQDEVKGYRADLNGRLRKLEVASAEVETREETREEFRSTSRKNLYATIVIITTIVSTASAIFVQIANKL